MKSKTALLLTALLISSQNVSWAASQPAKAKLSEVVSSPESMVAGKENVGDGDSFVRQILDRMRATRDYVYESTLTAYPSGKSVVEQGRLFFKDPNLVRFEVTSAKGRSGSVVVRQSDGKIKAKAGGLLSGIVVTLSPTSRLLMAANGINILESDFVSLIERMRNLAKNARKVMMTKSPVRVPGFDNVYIVELLNANNTVAERILVDATRSVPVGWMLFNDNKLGSFVQFNNLKLNAGSSDDLFSLDKHRNDSAKGFDGLVQSTPEKLITQAYKNDSGEGPTLPLSAVTINDVISFLPILSRQAESLGHDNLSKGAAERSTDEEGNTADGAALKPSSIPQSTNWSEDGQEGMLLRVTSIETMIAPLSFLARSFEKSAEDSELSSIGKQWKASVDKLEQSSAQLVQLLFSDQVDQANISEQSAAIKVEADKLKVLADQAYNKLD